MHHPDICNIMLIIEDYFLLVDDNEPEYQLEPMFNASSSNSSRWGIKIKRQLVNGYIHLEIYGEGKDDDTLLLKYYEHEITDKPKQAIRIESNFYCSDAVRNAVRTILTLDKNPNPDRECN